jgi:hypothetical protein
MHGPFSINSKVQHRIHSVWRGVFDCLARVNNHLSQPEMLLKCEMFGARHLNRKSIANSLSARYGDRPVLRWSYDSMLPLFLRMDWLECAECAQYRAFWSDLIRPRNMQFAMWHTSDRYIDILALGWWKCAHLKALFWSQILRILLSMSCVSHMFYTSVIVAYHLF